MPKLIFLTQAQIIERETQSNNFSRISADTNPRNYKPMRYISGQAIQLTSIQTTINEYRGQITDLISRVK